MGNFSVRIIRKCRCYCDFTILGWVKVRTKLIVCQLDWVFSEKSIVWGRGKETFRKPSAQNCSWRPTIPRWEGPYRKAESRSRWTKNHKLCVAAPVPLEENTQTMHFHKPTKTKLNTTLPSPALAQPWTLTFQLNLALTSFWTKKVLLQVISSDVCLACRAELTSKAEFTLNDTQEGQGQGSPRRLK